MTKNETVRVSITDYTREGLGIGHVQGMAVFVKNTVIGDDAEVVITKVKKNYAYGRALRIVSPSPDRVEPPCPVAAPCGGCQIQMMDYRAQLAYKQQQVRNCLQHIGGFSPEELDVVMEPVMGMENPFRYRNKAQYPIGRDKKGELTAGFYAGRTHSIIPCGDCLIGAKENERILKIVLRHMKTHRIDPYDEEAGRGLVRHVMIRKGFHTGQIMTVVVINGRKIPKEEELADALFEVPGMTSFSVNVNTGMTNVIMGSVTRTVRGEAWIEDEIGSVRFRISPRSFYQVNPLQTEKLYKTALEFAGLCGKETVWDLYCGIGTISLFLARQAKQVYGVEIIPEAIENAKENAALNGIDNAQFFAGKAEEVLPEKYRKENIYADVIVVDPPRKGCEQSVLDTMAAMQPARIVYVSCDPSTLARDVRYLTENGYALARVRPCDMFGHTVHVETVVLLTRNT